MHSLDKYSQLDNGMQRMLSAPKIFNAVADALEWCIASAEAQIVYRCLDDLLSWGHLSQNIVAMTLAF